MHLFIHHKVERICSLGHAAVVVFHINGFGLEHTRLDTLFREELDERIVLGQCLVATEKLKETFFLLFFVF